MPRKTPRACRGLPALSRGCKHAGKLGAHPVRDAILVRDVVDAELAHEGGESGRSPVVLHPPQGLREIGLPAPDGDVQRPLRRAGIDALDERARRRRVVAGADVLRPRR